MDTPAPLPLAERFIRIMHGVSLAVGNGIGRIPFSVRRSPSR
jgi:hypothetical protein